MSTKEAKDKARLLNIAMAYLAGTPDKRSNLKVERHLVLKALDLVIDLAQSARADINHEIIEEKMREPAYAADVKRRQERQEWRRQRANEINAKVSATRKETGRMASLGKAVLAVYDQVKLGGQPIGNVWYSQLEGLRDKGAFEASLCQALINRGKPAKDIQVRDLVTEAVLSEFVAKAKSAVQRVRAA